jgi:hypothetical protein
MLSAAGAVDAQLEARAKKLTVEQKKAAAAREEVRPHSLHFLPSLPVCTERTAWLARGVCTSHWPARCCRWRGGLQRRQRSWRWAKTGALLRSWSTLWSSKCASSSLSHLSLLEP